MEVRAAQRCRQAQPSVVANSPGCRTDARRRTV